MASDLAILFDVVGASEVDLVGYSMGGPLAVGAAGPALDSYGPRPVFLTVAAVQTLARVGIAVTGLRSRGRGRPRAATAAP